MTVANVRLTMREGHRGIGEERPATNRPHTMTDPHSDRRKRERRMRTT